MCVCVRVCMCVRVCVSIGAQVSPAVGFATAAAAVLAATASVPSQRPCQSAVFNRLYQPLKERRYAGCDITFAALWLVIMCCAGLYVLGNVVTGGYGMDVRPIISLCCDFLVLCVNLLILYFSRFRCFIYF